LKKLLFLPPAIALLSVCSCNPCADVHCLHGGLCNDGTCNCPVGYSGPRCENFDSCYQVTCLNGGTCLNGICNCPPGYSGSDCGTVLTPAKMIITKIVIDNFNLTNQGVPWDSISGPDLYLTINIGSGPNHSEFKSNHYTDQDTVPVTFSDGFPYTCNSPGSYYSVYLWDDDSPYVDEQIGGFHFKPINKDLGFPSTVHLKRDNFDFTLYVTWEF